MIQNLRTIRQNFFTAFGHFSIRNRFLVDKYECKTDSHCSNVEASSCQKSRFAGQKRRASRHKNEAEVQRTILRADAKGTAVGAVPPSRTAADGSGTAWNSKFGAMIASPGFPSVVPGKLKLGLVLNAALPSCISGDMVAFPLGPTPGVTAMAESVPAGAKAAR